MIFFAGDFDWVMSGNILAQSRDASPSNLEAVFVRKNETIVQDVGDGKVRTSSGAIIRYEMCEIADYDDQNYRDVPAGVEKGDWFTNQEQDVVAVVDTDDLRAMLRDGA